MRIATVDSESSHRDLIQYLKEADLISDLIPYKDGMGPESCDIVLTASAEWHSRSAVMIARARRQGLPTLHIIDGPIKWGPVWQDTVGDEAVSLKEASRLPFHQPVLSDKIACIGPAQGRILSSWGQHSKVEVTGLPKMDRYFAHRSAGRPPRISNGANDNPVNVLVVVANRPGYTNSEFDKSRQALFDLNGFLKEEAKSRMLHVIWRIGPRSPAVLPDRLMGTVDEGKTALLQALERADFVISSPSTATLEAMIMDIPTCMLDYVGSPEFLQAAWTIRSKPDMEKDLRSFFLPEERRMLFQRYLLHDQVRLDSPASPRIADLMKAMIGIAQKSAGEGIAPNYPDQMVGGFDYSGITPYPYSPEKLFPAHPVFARSDTGKLASELAHLQHYCRFLEQTMEQLTGDFSFDLILKTKIKTAFNRVKTLSDLKSPLLRAGRWLTRLARFGK